jgi:serine/threonine protein kinase/DNA-binding winged helix-turn-helix (wHTH) protein
MEGDFRLGEWLVKSQFCLVVAPNSRAIQLAPKTMQMLLYLADHAGEVVAPEILLRAVWDDPTVSESAVTGCMAELAKALKDDPTGAAMIQAIPGKGYRLVSSVTKLQAGSSRYQLGDRIGEGGMGVVYRGQDLHLGRAVAIKVIAEGILSSVSARRRFLQEALALSKLNHQNIGLVYDFDSLDGIDILVMEYVPGQTLRQILAAGPMPEKEIVRLSVQMAEGLAVAHAQGVVHCDLKPGNIIITPEGYLKILDFGLAQLVRPPEEISTRGSSQVKSAAGTLPYMAPEQLLGERVDSRTDIYAIGNVLYEMATGRLPFQQALASPLQEEIAHQPPPPPGRFRTDLSTRMEEIILKCLEKDPENRYQSVKELLVDLRRSSSPGIAVRLPDKQRRPAWRLAALLACTALAIIILGKSGIDNWSARRIPEHSQFQVTGTDGWKGQPAISRDGSMIAYTGSQSGNRDIYVTDNRGGSQSQLTTHLADDQDPAWLPDGTRIAFTTNRSGTWEIWEVGVRGGAQIKLLDNAIQPACSPDGKRIAFARPSPSGTFQIGIAPVDNVAAVQILARGNGALDATHPAWSSDSQTICYEENYNLWTVDVKSGRTQQLTFDGQASEPVWSPEAPYIYYSSYRDNHYAIWRIKPPKGRPQPVAEGTGNISNASIAEGGIFLAFTNESNQRQLVVMDRDSGAEITLPGTQAVMPSFAPDGSKVVFVSMRPGALGSLWVQQLTDGKPSGVPAPLATQSGSSSYPAFSPDGKWIAFYRILGDKRDIWIISRDGGQSLQFTDDGKQNVQPAWSPDSSKIAFVSRRGGNDQIWIAPIKDGKRTGPPLQLTHGEWSASLPAWSADNIIAFACENKAQKDVWLMPADGSKESWQITQGADVKWIRWDPRSRDLLTVACWGEDRLSLRRIDPKTGASKPLGHAVNFGGKDAWGFFDLAINGRWLVVQRDDLNSQIWLLRATRGRF